MVREKAAVWLGEVSACEEATRCIHTNDPNRFWRTTKRVDWMLYLLNKIQARRHGSWLVSKRNIQDLVVFLFPEWKPVDEFPWLTLAYKPQPRDAARADRLREIWPDLPILGV